MSIDTADIVKFNTYVFTDTGDRRLHYALVLLPEKLTSFAGNIYCCVITSKPPHTSCHLKLDQSIYTFFSCDSFIAFNRIDLESMSDMGKGNEQPKGRLIDTDVKKSYKLINQALFSPYLESSKISPVLKGVIVREWKKLKLRII